MKDVELKLVSELMKNSRRSDRELAREVGVSQPTISRTIAKLEKEGVIREYTMIPDFKRLGYELASLTFVAMRSGLAQEEIRKARKTTEHDMCAACPSEILMFERGLGMGFSGVIVAVHRDYESYAKLKDRIRDYDFVDHARTASFLIDLGDEVHYRYITFSTVAKDLLDDSQSAPQ